MKVTLTDKIESAHQWIDDDGKRHHTLIIGDRGAELDSAALETDGIGDAERALRKLVKLGLAAE